MRATGPVFVISKTFHLLSKGLHDCCLTSHIASFIHLKTSPVALNPLHLLHLSDLVSVVPVFVFNGVSVQDIRELHCVIVVVLTYCQFYLHLLANLVSQNHCYQPVNVKWTGPAPP